MTFALQQLANTVVSPYGPRRLVIKQNPAIVVFCYFTYLSMEAEQARLFSFLCRWTLAVEIASGPGRHRSTSFVEKTISRPRNTASTMVDH